MSEQQQIGICLIATRKYKQFVPAVVAGIKEYFLPTYPVTIFLFTDEFLEVADNERVSVSQHIIPPYKFPEATLYRYKIFHEHDWVLSKVDFLFYSDVDMGYVAEVGEEILNDGLTVVYHPGFYQFRNYVGHWGSNGVVKESLAWIEPSLRIGYFAGGFNGGQTTKFLEMANVLSGNISDDESRGVMAEYHDESHLNAYLKNKYKGQINVLPPSHCMVEQQPLRVAWGIENIEPKIIALAKNHAEIRS